jgi:hypothetical protein
MQAVAGEVHYISGLGTAGWRSEVRHGDQALPARTASALALERFVFLYPARIYSILCLPNSTVFHHRNVPCIPPGPSGTSLALRKWMWHGDPATGAPEHANRTQC